MLPGELARRLPERELARLHADAARRLLPQRRIELLLANIARLIDARVGGAENTRVADYLFDPVDTLDADAAAPPPADLDAVAAEQVAFFGFNPVKKTNSET